MIGVSRLTEIIKLGIVSPYVREKSVSILIIAKPESGKTQALKTFSSNNGVTFISDITYSGLIDLLNRASTKSLRTILIGDLLKVYGRNMNVSKNFFTLLNEVIEEGVRSIETYEHNITFNDFVRLNLIGGVTDKELLSQVNQWGQIGFLSRVLPFSYSYPQDLINKIFESIMCGSMKDIFEKIKVNKEKSISIQKDLCEQIRWSITEPLKYKFIGITKEEIYGLRFQKNLQTLAKCYAYLNNRKEVTKEDIEKLIHLSKWFNYDCKEIS